MAKLKRFQIHRYKAFQSAYFTHTLIKKVVSNLYHFDITHSKQKSQTLVFKSFEIFIIKSIIFNIYPPFFYHTDELKLPIYGARLFKQDCIYATSIDNLSSASFHMAVIIWSKVVFISIKNIYHSVQFDSTLFYN